MDIDVEDWYEKYGPMVIRRCRSILKDSDEAMDAVQDVFFNLLRAKGRLVGSFPSSLLYTMATNVCLNRLRASRAGLSFDWDESFFPATDGGYEQVDAKLLAEAILEDESEETRTICFMYHTDGMTLKEIGEAVGLSVSGVWKRLEVFKKRARLKLGEDLF